MRQSSFARTRGGNRPAGLPSELIYAIDSEDHVRLTSQGAAEARNSCRPPGTTISKHFSRKLRRCTRASLWGARVRNTPRGSGHVYQAHGLQPLTTRLESRVQPAR